ncbi:MAG: gluconate 2-dehydrogenase subunit 3 family protein [Chitinophagaceae bacterium]|nr:gluconate 2-dehydrogenase subunit 3 family protein [Chitinophagaceae bacterium]
MNRRKSIKALLVGTVSAGVLVEACKSEDKKAVVQDANAKVSGINRMKEEEEHYKEVISKTFFTAEEMATITILGDIIIPKDDVSGSASDAKVPEFIEFIVKDQPYHQTPMRGGLRWVDMYCLKNYGKAFKDASHEQQIALVDQIAYPKKAKPEMQQGVSFFNLMRNLVASGFYTTQIGYKDIGYIGNAPNQWNGVPDDVLKQYGLAYTEKELKECVSFNKA